MNILITYATRKGSTYEVAERIAAVGGGAGAVRKRGAQKEYQKEVEQQATSQQAKQETFNRAYGTCMQGKGYKVG